MTIAESVEILKALDAGTLTHAAAVDAMVARGELRAEAEFAIALHLGETGGDVIE
jgi:hypothetical protein